MRGEVDGQNRSEERWVNRMEDRNGLIEWVIGKVEEYTG